MEPAKQDFSREQPEAFPCHCETSQDNLHLSNVSYQDLQIPYPQGIPASAYEENPAWHLASTDTAQQIQQISVVMIKSARCAPVQVDHIPPPNYLDLSIFACLCCCCPLGLFAMVESNQVDNAVRRGDLVAAREASHNTRLLAAFSIALGTAFSLYIFINFYFGY